MSASEMLDLLRFLLEAGKRLVEFDPTFELPTDPKEALLVLANYEPQAITRVYFAEKIKEFFDGNNSAQ